MLLRSSQRRVKLAIMQNKVIAVIANFCLCERSEAISIFSAVPSRYSCLNSVSRCPQSYPPVTLILLFNTYRSPRMLVSAHI